MIYKITAAVLTLAGLVLVAKYDQHLLGLVLLLSGFLPGLGKGLRPR
jgi:hypothetical protein